MQTFVKLLKKLIRWLGKQVFLPTNRKPTIFGYETAMRIRGAWWTDGFFFIVGQGDIGQGTHTKLVQADKLKKFGVDKTMLYEIDPDGCFVHWPDKDVHLGWEQFVSLI